MKNIDEEIKALEDKKVRELDCPCLTGMFHDCGKDWADPINDMIDLKIEILKLKNKKQLII